MNIFKNYAKRSFIKAQNALELRQKNLAHSYAQHAVQLDPQLIDAWLILAATSEVHQSITFIQRALELDPSNQKALTGLKWTEKKLEKTHSISNQNEGNSTISQFSNEWLLFEANKLDADISHSDLIVGKNFHWRYRSFFSRWQFPFALMCTLLIILVAVFAPWLSPLDGKNESKYFKTVCDKFRCIPEPPQVDFILGTIKEFDVFHTLVWGSRQALNFGLITALSTTVIGTILGAIAAYTGGWLDRLVMRVCDAFLAFPVIAAVAMFTQVIATLTISSPGISLSTQIETIPENLNFFQSLLLNSDPIKIALILFSWMPYARIIHTQVLIIKKTEYVDAARAVGARQNRIIFSHILPNTLSPAVVMSTRDIGRMVVIQASFTFIGVGNSSSWATLLNIGKDWIIGPGGNILMRWWIYLPITAAIVFFGITWNLLGDEINLWLNPRNSSANL